MMSRRLATFAVLLASVSGLTACGHKHARTLNAETEGEYVDVGPLKYQVQISRQLNPADVEDQAYLGGLSRADRTLKKDEVWFAVFMRVENESGKPQRTSSSFRIEDTQENVYTPLPAPAVNPLSYRPEILQNKTYFPDPDSIAHFSPSGGAVLLFKIPVQSLDNRPLELRIQSPTPPVETGSVKLDV